MHFISILLFEKMNPPRISIALCTYNGATYLKAQLASFTAQTHLPFELIVCDDLSADDTFNIIEDFARESQFPVRCFRNQHRLGSTLNFDRAISMCGGDIIALADQDDVWRTDKLERLAHALNTPGCVAAFSDAEVADETLVSLGYNMWQRVRFNEEEQSRFANDAALNVLLKHYVVMGAALAFRADLRQVLLPIPDDWHHDAWIALIAATVGKMVAIDEPLVKYRQHDANQIGARKISRVQQYLYAFKVRRTEYLRQEIARFESLVTRVQSIPNANCEQIEAKLDHLKRRANFSPTRWKRIPGILKEIRSDGYARYSRNWGSIALDFLIQ